MQSQLKIDVSVIFVNYKTADYLKMSIQSIIDNSSNVNYELIVVDNNSCDNSYDVVQLFKELDIRYISLPDNIGFGRANNEGAKIARGNYLFFLNTDTKLLNNAIFELFHFMENNPKVGICGGNLYSENLKETHSCMPTRPSVGMELDSLLCHIPYKIRYGKRFDFNSSSKPQKVADIIGADLMIRKVIFDKLGGFDPDFFLYFEETELANRVENAGFDIYSIPNAKIIHLEGKSMKSVINMRKMALVSRKIYYLKTQTKTNRIIIDLIFVAKCSILMLLSALSLNRVYSNYWFYALKNGMIELW